MICTGCSCLCDDVEIVEGNVRHACRIGASIVLNREVARASVNDVEAEIERAIDLLKNGKVAIYGLNYSSMEAQKIALKLAEKLSAYVDNGSPLYDIARKILKGELPGGTFEDVRDYSYVIAYWRCDVHNSMPRHMSRYAYYPRGKKRPRGHEEDRFLAVIDVRKSHTAMLAKKNSVFIESGDDAKVIEEIRSALKGGIASREVMRLVKELEKSDYNSLFLGAPVNMKGFEDVANAFGHVFAMDPHPNSAGFFKLVSEFDVERVPLEDLLIDEKIDTLLVIGDDPLNSLPFRIARKLLDMNLIVIDPKISLTAKIANVVIPSAITGLESGGTMLRCDFVQMELDPPFDAEWDDLKILKRIERGL